METVTKSNQSQSSQVLRNQSLQKQLKAKEISYLENKLSLAKQEKQEISVKLIRLEKYHNIVDDFCSVISKAYPEPFKKLSNAGLITKLYQKEYETFSAFKKDLAEILYRIFFSEGKDKLYDFKDVSFLNQKHQDKLFQQGIYISDAWIHQFIACLSEKALVKNIVLQQLTPEWLWTRTLRLFIHLSELTRQALTKKVSIMHLMMPILNSATAFDKPHQNPANLRPYTKKELTILYGISSKVLRTWLKQHDDMLGKNTKLFNVKQVDFIFKFYGIPKTV